MVPWFIVVAVVLITALISFALLRVVLRKKAPNSIVRVPLSRAAGKTPAHIPERRRGERTACRVRVFIYGHAPDEEEPFYEEATTSNVSACGGTITVAANVSVGQKLLLTNTVTQENQECRVVRCTRNGHTKCEVAFEFAQSAPTFWQTPSVVFRVVQIVDKQN
jgi:PilZ domain